MLELVTFITSSLVDDPANVSVDIDEERRTVCIRADKSEIGKIIGKQGRIAKAIRSITRAAAAKEHKRYYIEISEK